VDHLQKDFLDLEIWPVVTDGHEGIWHTLFKNNKVKVCQLAARIVKSSS
jgi:hypothetical protein